MASELFRVTEEENALIKKSYSKSEEEVLDYVEELKEWIKIQPHIPQEQDEILLRRMVELNKFNMAKTKKKLDMFYAIRNIVPGFYDNRSLLNNEMQDIMKIINLMPLPHLLPTRQRAYLFRFTEENSVSFDVQCLAKLTFILYDLRIHNDPAPEEVFICDLGNMKLNYVVKMSPLVVARIYSVLEKAYSDRIKGIHFYNVPRYANVFVALVKYVFNFKLKNRVHTHKNLESLHEQIPKEYLPSEYGGTLKCFSEMHEDWQKFIENEDSWLTEQANKRTNEEFRPEKSKEPGMFSSLLNMFSKFKHSNEAPL